jgi:AbrB family looped-hinge helix DNA binding protein
MIVILRVDLLCQVVPLTRLPTDVIYKYMKIQFKEGFMTAVKIGVSRQVVIPKKLHDQLGLVPGDYLEVELEGDHLVLTPKALVEKRLAESLDDIRKGRVHGPFRSASALVRSLHGVKRTKTS